MDVTVTPGRLGGEVRAIASKSDAHRKLICAALADKPTTLQMSTMSEDIAATIGCLRALGADICASKDEVNITPIIKVPDEPLLDCRESGSTFRFMLPVAAALSERVSFTGSGRLPDRPISALMDAMKANGVAFSAEKLPFTTRGKLKSGEFILPGNISSQYITGLLLALPVLDGESSIRLTTPLESAGYVDITVSALQGFGVKAEVHDREYRVSGGGYRSPGGLCVDGDWSNAAFFLAAGAIGNAVAVSGLSMDSPQGDKKIIDIISNFGGYVNINNDAVTVRPAQLHGAAIDMREVPDLAPILAVLACCAQGETRLVNAGRLRLKESDRLAAIAAMLRALGGVVREMPDGLVIRGGALNGGRVDSFHDHRMVMAAAIASIVCKGPVTILDAGAVSKSYPAFFEDFKALGGECRVI